MSNGEKCIIVAYYTSGPYAGEAGRLIQSLQVLGLAHDVQPLKSRGDWLGNVHLRPEHLQLMRQRYPRRSLLSLDVDCVVHANPLPYLGGLDCELAVRFIRPHEPLPGTLFLRATSAVDNLLKRWRAINAKRPARPDRFNFLDALRDSGGLKIAKLPAEYACIFDRDDITGPLIEHFQASREFRRPHRRTAALSRRRARLAQLEAGG